MKRRTIRRREVRYNRPEVAGIFYHENMTYYHNASSLAGKVILVYPALAGQKRMGEYQS